jgi:hypothetical protein
MAINQGINITGACDIHARNVEAADLQPPRVGRVDAQHLEHLRGAAHGCHALAGGADKQQLVEAAPERVVIVVGEQRDLLPGRRRPALGAQLAD